MNEKLLLLGSLEVSTPWCFLTLYVLKRIIVQINSVFSQEKTFEIMIFQYFEFYTNLDTEILKPRDKIRSGVIFNAECRKQLRFSASRLYFNCRKLTVVSFFGYY